MTHTTSNEDETKNLGQKIITDLQGNNIICLKGDLGAGKTTFVTGIGNFLGFEKIVSPTFVLIKKHQIDPTHKKVSFKNFWHIDLYRLDNEKEAMHLGLRDLWEDKNNLVIIEWPEKVEHLLPKNRIEIKITIESENTRNFEVNYL